MKARIDAEGTLTVEAESPLEAWALQNWEKHYGKGRKGERTVLRVKPFLLPSEVQGWVSMASYTNVSDLTGGSLS